MQRVEFLTGAAALIATTVAPNSQSARFGALERRSGGRLGVFILDTSNGRSLAYRAGERFPMCSTFKLLAVGATLSRIDAGKERLDQRIRYTSADLLEYAPVTRAHVRQGFMTLGDLCKAAIELSDNTAANLILRTIGGPPAVTAYARSLGDNVTRLDRKEPELNSSIPGDPRDTTSPQAIARDMQALVLGNALSTSSREHLRSWLIGSQTGTTCIRAGVPKTWQAGDKTGSGRNGTRNDVAVIWPQGGAPLIVSAYLTGATVDDERRNAVLADVGRVAAETFR